MRRATAALISASGQSGFTLRKWLRAASTAISHNSKAASHFCSGVMRAITER
jgi:hypothetical protein